MVQRLFAVALLIGFTMALNVTVVAAAETPEPVNAGCKIPSYYAAQVGEMTALPPKRLMWWTELWAHEENWGCERAFANESIRRGSAQGMAMLGHSYGKGSPFANIPRQIEWCQKAYLRARDTEVPDDIDVVMNYCPEPVIAKVARPSDRTMIAAAVARNQARWEASRYTLLSFLMDNRCDTRCHAERQRQNAIAFDEWAHSQEP